MDEVKAIEFPAVSQADIPHFLELVEAIWIPTFRPIIESPRLERLYDGMYSAEIIRELIGQTNYLLAYIRTSNDGEDIGYLGLRYEQEAMQLDKIYIHPAHQNKGYGFSALKSVLDIALKKDFHRIWLRVNRGNCQAIRFYQRNGFAIEKAIDYPANGGFVYDDYILGRAC